MDKTRNKKSISRVKKWPYSQTRKGVFDFKEDDPETIHYEPGLSGDLARLVKLQKEKLIKEMMDWICVSLARFHRNWEELDFRPPKTKECVRNLKVACSQLQDAIQSLDKTVAKELNEIRVQNEILHPIDNLYLKAAHALEAMSKSGSKLSDEDRSQLKKTAGGIKAQIEEEKNKSSAVAKLNDLFVAAKRAEFKSIIWLDTLGKKERRGSITENAAHILYRDLFNIFTYYAKRRRSDLIPAELISEKAKFAALVLDAQGIPRPEIGTPDMGKQFAGELWRLAEKHRCPKGLKPPFPA